MNDSFPDLGRYITILDRLMKMYYNRSLADYQIGWGQQFFLEYIYDHPGASAQEMVQHIRVDKGTLTKVMKKLTSLGYVKVVKSETDRRAKLLYLTDEAVPVAKRLKEIHRCFYQSLCSDISPPDIERTVQIMEQMMENLNQKVWHRMEE